MTISSTDPRVLATLLLALHDRLNTIRAPRWQRENVSGFARTGWIECPKCKGTGETTWKHRTVRCDRQHCNGNGGWYGDPMMAAKISRPIDANDHPDSSVLAFTGRILDMSVPELDRLDHAIAVTLGLDDDLEQEARTAARADHPSTLQLWDGLSIMLRDFPHHGGILYRVFVWAWTPEQHLGETDRELVDDALHILGETLRVRSPGFRAPSWALRAVEAERIAEKERNGRPQLTPVQRAHRDQEIRRLSFNGRSQAQIAARVGCDQATVSRVLAKKEAA